MEQKYIGIDYGTKRVGIAVSDTSGTLAFPHTVLTNSDHLLDELLDVINHEGAMAIVLGESTDFKGKENPVMEAIHAFKKELEKRSQLPVHFESEFLTSLEAAREFGEDDMHDARAAALILQRFLDKQK